MEEITNKNSSGTIIGKSVFVYDGLGRKRISREFTYNAATNVYTKTEEIRRIYDGMDVIQERDANNVVKTNYVRAGNIGGLLSKSKREAGQQDVHLYYHYDAQGNVVQMTNATQSTVADYRYDAWGNSRLATGTEAAGNRYRFSTKELCSGGLYDYGLRFYNPSIGRFINRDPSGEAGGLNLYAAFANNPASMVDEYGLSAGSWVQSFARGVWDGLMGGGMTFLESMAVAGAVTFLMGSCTGAIPAITAAIGIIGAAVGIAGLVDAVMGIINSDLCPDEKAYQLGLMVGGALAGIAGGKLGNKFGPKNPGCFVAGTLVLMADGSYQAIEKVKAGDWVLSKDEASGKVEKKQVENNTVRVVATTLLFTFNDGSQVETTDEHPLYVEGQGFKAAKEVGIGTSIVTRAGPSLRVTNVDHREGTTLVYNFTVEGFHTYFVGNDLWVHNYPVPVPGGGGGGGNGPANLPPRRGSGHKNDEVSPIRDSKGNITREFPPTAKGHGFPDIIDNYADSGSAFNLNNGARLYQVAGDYNGVGGVFEWITQDGFTTHRRFIGGGQITGSPNQIVR